MNEALKVVIRAFQQEVQRGLALFRKHRGIEDLMAWRDHGLPRSGYLDAERRHRYAFHGIGCELQLGPELHIDWDFGHGGRMDGFDLWRLQQFLEERPVLQVALSLDGLRSAFESATRDGSILSPWQAEHDSLYYLADDLQSPKAC